MNLSDLDQLRRDLQLTRQRLADCTKALATSEEHAGKLREENEKLKGRMHKAVGVLLPEGTTLSNNWDNYKEPGY